MATRNRRVGKGGHYVQHSNPGPNTLIIDRYENFEGVGVLVARFPATIVPLTAARLAELAIQSAWSAQAVTELLIL